MRKLFFMLLLAVITMLNCQAVTVNTTAGGLAQAVGDNTSITVLKVTGTMDARDFFFITDKLNDLTSLDLSQVTIAPFERNTALYGTVTKYDANEIPRTAFFGKKLTTVSLPAGLETIGFAAFAGCYQLTSITLPSTVTFIDDYAFAGSALTSVEIPVSVVSLGKGLFARCEALTTAVINCMTVSNFAFLGDIALSNVQLGSGVKLIQNGAFNGCKALKSLTIDPACRMSHIGEEAFINSGLENIDLTTLGVGTIGDWAFAQTRLSSMVVPDAMTDLGVGALAHNPLLTSVVLPSLGHRAGTRGAPSRFALEEIKDYTFAGNEVLNAGSMIGEGVTSIGSYALYNVCAEMDTMRLPSTLTYLGDRAMAGMTGMQVLKTDAESVPSLGNEVWAGVNQPSVPLIAPNPSSEMLYKQADQWMDFYFQSTIDFILGDVDGDGEVTISDVTLLVDYLLAGEATIDLNAADVDGDGSPSIGDVSLIIDMLLNSSSSLSLSTIHAIAADRCITTGDALIVQPVTLRPGETRTVEVALDNTEHEYTAVQCEIVLPEGVKLVGVEGIDRGRQHTCRSMGNKVDDNVYTMIEASLELDRFAGDHGNIVRLTIAAGDEFASSDAEVMLTNVVLVAPDHRRFLAGDASGRINDGSGVEQISADKQVASVRYINVAGMESNEPFDGMNIVVTTYTDGTTTTAKVLR